MSYTCLATINTPLSNSNVWLHRVKFICRHSLLQAHLTDIPQTSSQQFPLTMLLKMCHWSTREGGRVSQWRLSQSEWMKKTSLMNCRKSFMSTLYPHAMQSFLLQESLSPYATVSGVVYEANPVWLINFPCSVSLPRCLICQEWLHCDWRIWWEGNPAIRQIWWHKQTHKSHYFYTPRNCSRYSYKWLTV